MLVDPSECLRVKILPNACKLVTCKSAEPDLSLLNDPSPRRQPLMLLNHEAG